MTHSSPEGKNWRGRKPDYTPERVDEGYVPPAIARVHEGYREGVGLSYGNDLTLWTIQGLAAADAAAQGHLPAVPSPLAPPPAEHRPWWKFRIH